LAVAGTGAFGGNTANLNGRLRAVLGELERALDDLDLPRDAADREMAALSPAARRAAAPMASRRARPV
jgi:hypothetical protein